MALLDPSLAGTFLMQYKRLLCTIASKPMENINDHTEAPCEWGGSSPPSGTKIIDFFRSLHCFPP